MDVLCAHLSFPLVVHSQKENIANERPGLRPTAAFAPATVAGAVVLVRVAVAVNLVLINFH